MIANQPRGSLVWTLALAYLGMALLAAVTVRLMSLSFEISALDRDLAGGRLERATAEAAAQLTADLPIDAGSDPALVQRRLRASLSAIQASLSDMGHEGVLSELVNPIGMEIQSPDGSVLARLGHFAPLDPPPGPIVHPPAKVVRVEMGVEGAWRYAAPLRGRDGSLAGLLTVELTRHPPGLRAMMGDGFEWPALLVYLLVFGLGTALLLRFTVTRRLGTIARTADAWSRGDFSHAVDDASADEIGQLSRRLDQMARQLEILVAIRAELAGVSERQRLARDLHDTVKQKAFALQLQLAAVSRSPALSPDMVRTIEDARGITREIQEELVLLIGEADAPSNAPFVTALAERAQTWGRRGGFVARCDLDAADAVPSGQHSALFRIVDEALANVMRHAEAAHADIRLVAEGGKFVLSVEDDGCGLRGQGEGMGLANMRRRAAELPDGALTVEPRTGGGVGVTLSWARSITSAP